MGYGANVRDASWPLLLDAHMRLILRLEWWCKVAPTPDAYVRVLIADSLCLYVWYWGDERVRDSIRIVKYTLLFVHSFSGVCV
jgi:hypothetical protein